MAEAFKNVYSQHSIQNMASHLGRAMSECVPQSSFDQQAFISMATNDLDSLEMKQRADQIVEALVKYLPKDFESCAKVFLASLAKEEDGAGMGNTEPRQNTGIEGWLIAPMAEYVGKFGLDNFDLSMQLFKAFTMRFTSEFGIRYFLKQKPKQTLVYLKAWLEDDNQHVRRLVSEGTRPRLPWGMRLDNFIVDPEPVIEIISKLKDDESEYVRRSVANNLNDIAKDHPERVSALAKQWLKNASKDRIRLVKHACRTLFKQGHPATLSAFGFEAPKLDSVKFSIKPETVKVGETLDIKFEANANVSQTWMIDYVIHHQKANGSMSPKVFKGKQVNTQKGRVVEFSKKHSFKNVTTRTYHIGEHAIEIVINGQSICRQRFELVLI
jgi:3-methyladenine DNA glycosylase AlkC